MTLVSTAERWIREGRALPIPREISIEFDEFLMGLPWLGTRLDWSKMPPTESIDTASVERRRLFAWARRTRIGSHTHIAVWYSAARGGVVVPMEVALLSLDELYREAPGVRYAFGIDVHPDQMRPEYTALLQYGGGDEIIAVRAGE